MPQTRRNREIKTRWNSHSAEIAELDARENNGLYSTYDYPTSGYFES